MYKASYIQKRGEKNKAWKTRWMVTEPDGLSYYKRENKDKMGCIDFQSIMEVKCTSDGKKLSGFDIVTPDRTFIIACTSVRERDQWVEVIEKRRESVRKRSVTTSVLPASGGSHFQTAAGRPTPPPKDLPAVGTRKITMQLQDKLKNLEELKQIRNVASVRHILNTKDNLGRSIAKIGTKIQGTLNGLPPIGKLFVAIEEATFYKAEPTARPVISAYFEEQYITSVPSKNNDNPRWKEIFLFQVSSLESKFKLKIIDSTVNTLMGSAKIPIKSLADGVASKQFTNLVVKDLNASNDLMKKVVTIVGKALVSWRYEPDKPLDQSMENDLPSIGDRRLGSFHIIVLEARNLKLRKTGSLPHPCLVLSYNKQELQSPSTAIEPSIDPKWDFGTIFQVSKDSGLKDCLIKVIDMDKIQRPLLGRVVVSQEMLESSLLNEMIVWLPMTRVDEEGNEEDAGEIHLRFRYRLTQDEVIQQAEPVPINDEEDDHSDLADSEQSGAAAASTAAADPFNDLRSSTRSESIRVGTQRTMTAEKLTGPFSLETAISQAHEIYDLLYKVIIIGNSGVGKTNLLGRWLENKFVSTSATINVEFGAKMFDIDGKIVKVQLWDTAGQEQYRAVTRSYYRKSAGAIIVYDITDQHSFNNVPVWLNDIRAAEGNEDTQILLVGNKSDVEFGRKVSTQEGIDLSAKEGLNFLETSALNGSNVQRAFQIVLQDIHALAEKKLVSENKPVVDLVETIHLDTYSGGPNQDDSTCCGGSTSSNSNESIFNSFSSLFNSENK